MSPLPQQDEATKAESTAAAAAPDDDDDEVDDEWDSCEILELPQNVYTCAFVLAQNATPGM
jgi:hypothetical protein